MKHLLRKTLLLPILLLVSCVLFAQQKTVTGKVVDADGKPVSGVNVGIKGSTTNTTTDADGNYSIVVASNESVLKFSSASFLYQEQLVGTKTTVDLTMQKDAKQLDDVVVVGYGTQRKRNVTGSIVSVDTKRLEDLPVSSLAEMLRGQVPGLNVSGGSNRPGNLATLSIRQQFNWGKDGGGTIPLIVIDDVVQIDPSTNLPTLDQFNRLDLSEVESITVLRDASAAIYGTRASQGAIVIKTKRGKVGPPKLSYSGKFETNDAISHGKVMNAKEYGIFNNRLQRGLGNTVAGNPNNFFSAAELSRMDSLNYDWMRNDWERANGMQHSLNINGGSDKATYFAGGSYFTQGANLGEQDFKRWTFRSGTEVKIANGFKFSALLSGNNSDIENSFTKINFQDGYAVGGEQNDYSVLLHMPRYIPWEYTINGTKRYISPVLGPNKTGSATGNNSLSNWNYYEMLTNGSKAVNNSFSYTGNFSLQYEVPFIKGLSFKGTYAKTYNSSKSEQVQMPLTLFQGTNLATANNHLFSPTTTWSAAIINRNNSRVSYDNITSTSEQVNFFANYERNFGDHNISAIVSGERSQINFEKRYQIWDNPVAGIYNGVSASTLGTLNAQNSFTNKSIGGTMSYLGRVNYSFKDRYLATVLFRTDASSKFSPENYWGFFPSISLGWIVSDEAFFKVNWINYLKIRGSLGKTGNDNVKAWRWMQLYSILADKGMAFGTNGGLFTYGLTPETAPNPNIRWDKTIQRNIGVDVAMLKSRLSVNLDYYFNSGRDLLTDMSGAINVPLTVGGSFAEQNYGNVNSWGAEAGVTWSDRIGKNFTYSIGSNFGWSDNKVTKYIDKPFNYESTFAGKQREGYSIINAVWGFETWRGTSTVDGLLRTNEDIDAYWAYLTDLATKAGTTPRYFDITAKSGLRKGMLAYKDVRGDLNAITRTIAGQDGRIATEQDFVELAKSSRTYGVATNLSFGWKSISLMAQVATSWGGFNTLDRVKQGTASTNAGWSNAAYLNDMYDSTDNPLGKYPNIAFYDNAYQTSDFWQLPSFRCVVRNMSIGFAVPKEWAAKAHIANAKLVLSGYNLWDLYNPNPGKFKNMYDSPNVGYPTLRTWSLGVNVGF